MGTLRAMTLAPVRSSGLDSGLQLDVSPVAGALGAEVRGLDPGRLDEPAAAALREALDTHLVLFLPGLDPTVEQLRDIGAAFGELEVHPYIDKVDDNTPEVCVLDTSATPKADIWHTDVTYSQHPPIAALLHMVKCPPAGGDTMWINCCEVCDSLSVPMQAFLAGLTCIHDDGKQGSLRAEHPVVRGPPRHRPAQPVRQQAARAAHPAAVTAREPGPAGLPVPLAGAGQVQLPVALDAR